MNSTSLTSKFKSNSSLIISIASLGLIYYALSSPSIDQINHSRLASSDQVPSSNPKLDHLKFKKKNRKRRSTSSRIWNAIKNYLIEPLATTSRLIYLLTLFLPLLISSPLLLLEYVELAHPSNRPSFDPTNPNSIVERASTIWWYKLLVNSMQSAGPTFIKLAQWAGSRSDLFPATLCDHFGKLHSSGQPHSLAYTKRVLEKAFNSNFEDIFTLFNPEPIGVGAVAQVYKATLKPDLLPVSYLEPKRLDGSDQLSISSLSRRLLSISPDPPILTPSPTVAIKVLHPRVRKNITRDLKIMGFFAHLVNCFPGAEWLSFPEEVSVFGELMKSQVDLTVEAENLDRFETNFSHRKTVSFPRPLKSFTTDKVLVEEFEDALPLKYFLRGRESSGPFDYRISDIGLDAFLHMLLIDNFVHADLHPGNIMVRFYKPTTKSNLRSLWRRMTGREDKDVKDEDTELTTEVVHRLRKLSKDPIAWNLELERLDRQGFQPELVFIDSGLVNELNQKNRRNFLDLFQAIACFDGYRAGKLMVERCRTPELVNDEETFSMKIQHLALKVKSQTFSLANIKVSDVLIKVLTAVREHHVKMEADFINTVLSILILEGIGRQLNPSLDLFQSALPILRSLGSQHLNAGGQCSTAVHYGSMIKIWLVLEARHFASIASSELDSMVKYDLFMPNV